MRFRRSDALALLAVPLVVAAFKAGGAVWPTICLMLAGASVVFASAGHEELGWKQRVGVCTLVFAVALGLVAYLYRVNLARELKEQVAPLVASALASPVSSNCPIPSGAVALYLGNRVSVINKFPHVVFRARGEDVFVIERDASGLLVSLRVFDDRGNIVARLARNQFAAMNSASHVKRPSPSSLSVFDDRDAKVLDVQFLNPQAIKITGFLRYPGVDPIVITEKYLGRGGAIAPPACTTGVEAEFAIN